MRILAAAALVSMTACAGLYSQPSQKVHRPGTDTYQAELDREKAAAEAADKARREAQVDTCDARFFEAPGTALKKHKTGAAAAVKLANTADDKLVKAGPQPMDEVAAAQVTSAIAQAREALASDPYSPQATYTMAVAYGKAHRKQCALQLLHRLVALSAHPDLNQDATRMIDQAAADPTFAPYKTAALDALGR